MRCTDHGRDVGHRRGDGPAVRGRGGSRRDHRAQRRAGRGGRGRHRRPRWRGALRTGRRPDRRGVSPRRRGHRRGVRPTRCPVQQRGRLRGERHDRLFRGRVGCAGRHELEGRVPDVEVRAASHGRARSRIDRALRVGVGLGRRGTSRGLLRGQGRDGRHDEGDGARPRTARDPRQRDLPRRYGHADGARGCASAGHDLGSVRAGRRRGSSDRADGNAPRRSPAQCCSSPATRPRT